MLGRPAKLADRRFAWRLQNGNFAEKSTNPSIAFAGLSFAIFLSTSSSINSTNPAPNREGVMNRSRTFCLADNAVISGVAPPTAFVVIKVPPGAGMNSLLLPRNPARISVMGPLPPGRP